MGTALLGQEGCKGRTNGGNRQGDRRDGSLRRSGSGRGREGEGAPGQKTDVAPITSRQKGYPFEVFIPPGERVSGVVLADQARSLDWRARRLKVKGRASGGGDGLSGRHPRDRDRSVASGRRGPHGPRPPTPPGVRFRTTAVHVT
ncbi:type II toxin-antitoxin system PemK/MazF family toxin [Desulfolutivibrio sulfoxidireducens]|uniref:type II toxin-antitoxin system PemK/MazF family toxin n=1 Tax=Desulfolutivibrio sulfoxidireducens TaxID=2773299 RepID=UPI00159CFAE8|nr:type II toxin-antitoxin system PemK/MazF family toxin [Desulfolutivibrio sulfoxidireducens]QLA21668.1 hypothetical protein GD604_12295 [Desulfolutivibrio sulfoxidireducens]